MPFVNRFEKTFSRLLERGRLRGQYDAPKNWTKLAKNAAIHLQENERLAKFASCNAEPYNHTEKRPECPHLGGDRERW